MAPSSLGQSYLAFVSIRFGADPNARRKQQGSVLPRNDSDLGSGLIDHSQNMTAAAMQIAEK
jgi:hypothetical protein